MPAPSSSLAARGLAFAAAALLLLVAGRTEAQEPPECLSFNPGDWPAPARPYFMLVVDTSGSMTACTTPPTDYPVECNQNAPGYKLNSCGLVPNRLNDTKCALQQTVLAFAGQVNFGMATYATYLSNCPAGACQSDCGTPTGANDCFGDVYGCAWNTFPGAPANAAGCGNNPACQSGPGPAPPNFPEHGWRNGGNIVVPMLQDPFWGQAPASNVPELLEWFDGQCGNNKELFAGGQTPIGGSLQAAAQYLRAGWSIWSPTNYCAPAYSFLTPMDGQDRDCRSVNVLLVTDGDETCDNNAFAISAAADLYQNGVTLGGKTWPVKVHVINFAGGNQFITDQIASAGGTGASLFATNEVQLAQGLSAIISEAIAPETCDNADNNCNGCTDEGYKHYCNQNQTCCSWSNQAQRETCLTQYEDSIATSPPDGDLTLLPCTTPGQQQNPASWLCYDPGDICDDSDNNCQDGVDEGQLKCGNPPHCPSAEVCNGIDDDCNGQIDDGNVCGSCSPSPEVCDGCDNDCDGVVDNPPPGGFPTLSCGLANPANCQGTITCNPPQSVPPGTCSAGGGYGQCTNSPQPEICDGIDNNCNGQIDEGYVSEGCVPPSHPAGLSYGGNSQCQLGTTQCQNGAVVCVGGSGPSAEVCDGIDNDCNGQVDESPVFGEGQPCGVTNPPCSPGTTACVNGALVCQGGIPPQPEICDGIDNNCNGQIDEAPLADGPQPGQTGCWNEPGNCCSHQNLSWCPPPGGTCHAPGVLSAPCAAGALQCDGAAGWICVGPTGPQPEVCDGIDNDCNGQPDDGNLPQVGQPCGTNVGECQEGAFACLAGALDCVGDVGPQQEQCNNLDDNCNGLIDDGIPAMGPCTVPYDTTLFPNSNPTQAPCQPGQLQCDGMGNIICVGGKGPEAEICDGIDNDCDSLVDEAGPAPDGIDGTANPLPPPNASIGDACGVSTGACEAGNYACLNGLFACLGGVGPAVETCDCEDNDCDGLEDELPGMGEPPLCSPGKDCVKGARFCQCAQPCGGGEFPCPPGQTCAEVTVQGAGTVGQYCVVDFEAQCGDCTTKTVSDGNGDALCAPAGTDPAGCKNTPICACRGPAGCNEPCLNVDCGAPQVCSNFGPTPGKCVDDICYYTGCPGCNKACHDGACVENPCQPGVCPADEVCKPNANFTSFSCVPSCANVTCPAGEKCDAGACVPWCHPECRADQACDPATLECVPSQCTPSSCPNGAYCDPLTGTCGDYPCEGVVCPDDQTCHDGNCFGEGQGGAGGAGGGSGGGGGTGPGAGPSGQGGAGANESGVFGLPTGGGGCACETAGRPTGDPPWRWLWAVSLVGLVVLRRRRGKDVAA